jgi:hypothetical protein
MNLTAQYFNSPCRVLKTIHESPRPECPLLAQSGHPNALSRCPLSGVKPT